MRFHVAGSQAGIASIKTQRQRRNGHQVGQFLRGSSLLGATYVVAQRMSRVIIDLCFDNPATYSQHPAINERMYHNYNSCWFRLVLCYINWKKY